MSSHAPQAPGEGEPRERGPVLDSPGRHLASNPTPAEPSVVVRTPAKKRAKVVFSVLVAAAALGAAAGWILSRGHESTDDAVVEGHVLSISSRIGGQVARVLVKDNQLVEAGQVLVELDQTELQAKVEVARADAQAALAQVELAKAQLDLTDRNANAGLKQARGSVLQASSSVASTKAQVTQVHADLAAAGSRLKLTTLELDRARGLFASQAVPQAEMDMRQTNYDQAKATLEQVQARLESTKAAMSGGYAGVVQAEGRLAAALTAPQQVEAARAQVQLAAARQKQVEAALTVAELNFSYAKIVSPVRGMVARRTVEVGNMVSPDRALLAVVPLDEMWIVANYKETQIGNMRPGQNAVVVLDTYGNRKLRGHVESLAAGTGSRFALLPPDNASGNFIKVVQRVPVLIRLDDQQGLTLRPGLSAEVTVSVQ
jgi:membrane fusion protein, multidrug efflux system